ncbi:conserved hypothetical protein [Candida tropicalis MYA-3404]|uniref:Uncharacterized protein n=1 Tax=Candida tropicalis (strain ATCC MYA-3404 / T1) TaxID=294747 RepID=C5M3K9_CANTT|nr:conserved hypothetical protein [Candida tropicalis MYA-3404]EER35909.1 conserved hypothetical protein [Candida tropicalis MYA-3404]KAG4410025.1 hypothetical protein JTP64_000663 [Candida tropicalis]
MTDIEPYVDPIISLIQDPNLNKDKFKSSQLIHLIHEISERRINKLCSTSFKILQTLENIQLKFKSWEFLSLDFNSDNHFHNNNNDDKIKDFNAGIANKVMIACTEINVKIAKISSDIDIISKNSKTLAPRDLMSDAGTMLTSLLLRIIKLKNDVVEQLSIAYSKSKLILIGEELEMWEDENTVTYYKTFISALLQQLNDAIEQGDFDAKYECLAVINDLEQMFEKFRVEKLIDESLEESRLVEQQHQKQKEEETKLQRQFQYEDEDDDVHIDSESDFFGTKNDSPPEDSFSEYSAFSSLSPQVPMVRSITGHKDHDSVSNYQGTITDELPYLMTAFSSAKNFEMDVNNYKIEEEKENNLSKSHKRSIAKQQQSESQGQQTQFKKPFFPKTNLPDASLYSESNVIHPPLYSSSILRTFGIKPQVINVPEESVTGEKKKIKKHNKPLLLTEENVSHLDFID